MEFKKFPNKKILLAEDSELNQMFISTILTNWEIMITIVKNGEEAIEVLKKNNFDLILMDIQMPILDGLTTTQQIRNILNLKDIIIIGLSADKISFSDHEILQLGFNDLIYKPIEIEELNFILSKYF
jgi:CheY-like chemotaxis protein